MKTPMPPKRTPAQLRKREGELLAELQAQHGYAFADTLPDRDRSSMMADRTGGKLKLSSAVVLKVYVPYNGSLGRAVALSRAKGAKAKLRAKAAP